MCHTMHASAHVHALSALAEGCIVCGTQESLALVHAVRRRTAYAPMLDAAPRESRVQGTGKRGSRLSSSRRRRLLSLHAEKKALAGQLALGYASPRLSVTRRMCADCHAFFEAVSKYAGRSIVCTDARVRHVFTNGRCSCRADADEEVEEV